MGWEMCLWFKRNIIWNIGTIQTNELILCTQDSIEPEWDGQHEYDESWWLAKMQSHAFQPFPTTRVTRPSN